MTVEATKIFPKTSAKLTIPESTPYLRVLEVRTWKALEAEGQKLVELNTVSMYAC